MAEFDKFAADYKQILDRSTALAGESSEYFTEYKAAYVEKLIEKAGSNKILDFGCGVGTLSTAIAKRRAGLELHGFDVSTDSLEEVPVELRRGGLYTADLSALEHDYSLVVISNVLHHIPVGERQGTIDRLTRVLAAGGQILVFEHNPLNPLTRLVVSRCPFDDNAISAASGRNEELLPEVGPDGGETGLHYLLS